MLGFSNRSWARLFRDGSWVLFGQILTIVAGLVGVRVLTELASPAVFGETALWLGVVTLARNFFVIPLSNYQLRFHPEYKQRGQLTAFLNRMSVLTNRGSLATAAVGAMAYFTWVVATGEPFRPTLLIAILVMYRVDAYRSHFQNVLNAERRQQSLALWTSIESWAVMVLSAAALWVTSTTESYLIGTAVSWVAILFFFRPPKCGGSDPIPEPTDWTITTRRELIAYGLPFVPLALFSWLLHFGSRYVLGLQGPDVVGVYVAAFSIASKPAIMVSSLIGIVARPIVFNAVADGRRTYADRVFVLWAVGIACTGTLICLVLYVLSPWIVKWLLAPEYRKGAPEVILWTAIGYCLYALIVVIEVRIMAYGKSTHLIIPVFFGALTAIALNYWLVPTHGSLGAAWASSGGFLGQLIVSYVSMIRARN